MKREKNDYDNLRHIALNNLIENYKLYIVIIRDTYNNSDVYTEHFSKNLENICLIKELNYVFTKLNLKMAIYILNIENNKTSNHSVDVEEYKYHIQDSNEIFAVLGDIKYQKDFKNKDNKHLINNII